MNDPDSLRMLDNQKLALTTTTLRLFDVIQSKLMDGFIDSKSSYEGLTALQPLVVSGVPKSIRVSDTNEAGVTSTSSTGHSTSSSKRHRNHKNGLNEHTSRTFSYSKRTRGRSKNFEDGVRDFGSEVSCEYSKQSDDQTSCTDSKTTLSTADKIIHSTNKNEFFAKVMVHCGTSNELNTENSMGFASYG